MKQRTLFRTVYGSRLYGTATPTSDSDFKEITLPDIRVLLLGGKLANSVKQTSPGVGANGPEDIDVEYIPLQIFARDFAAGQTYAYELAFTIIKNGNTRNLSTLQDTKNLYEFTRDLASMYLTSNMSALVGYTQNQINVLSVKGERVSALKLLIELTENRQGATVIDLIDDDTGARLDLQYADLAKSFPKYFSTLAETASNCTPPQRVLSILNKQYPINTKFPELNKLLKQRLSKYGARSVSSADSGDVDWKGVAHGMRIVDQGIELLKYKTMTFPVSLEQRTKLLDIRAGKFNVDNVLSEIQEKLVLLEQLQAASDLPSNPPTSFDDWLSDRLMRFYDLAV
jgi:hypothetical protein